MSATRTKWTPSNWASMRPFGMGLQKPNNYFEILRAVSENRDNLGYAWRILNEGVCDGCALGTSGMTDWTLPGVHLCNIRLRLLRLNTMGPLDPAILEDVASLKKQNAAALRELGRIPVPMVRHKGDKGFTPTSWDDALDEIVAKIDDTTPERLAFYLTSRGIPNEAYYVAQKAARAIGTNNIDNAARVCHSPSTTALKAAIGAGATTCSYSDWLESDLIVFFGSNVANNQPVATKYLHYAKKNGAKIAVVNPYREPGMARYWIPSVPESALFGTRIADRFFLINIGADTAFINGVLKHMIASGHTDDTFIAKHTAGFDELRAFLDTTPWEELERACGATRQDMQALGDMLGSAQKAIFVWSMGITQHAHGVDNVRAIINLALTRGFVGRPGCGLMPIRGHSGVQGGAEMGAYSTALPGGLPITEENAARLSEAWGFDVPTRPGLTAPEMIDAADNGELDLLFSVGGNFVEVLPDPDFVEQALAKIPLRAHMDLVLSPQMFIDPEETVIILPATTRYETPGGVTQTSTERRVIFSPEIPGPRIEAARPEHEVFADLARRTRSVRSVRSDRPNPFNFPDTSAIRQEIAQIVPFYDGIQNLRQRGDHFQYGGPHLCANWTFPTPDAKAHFETIERRPPELQAGTFLLTTRRGKQFNTMIHESKDAITGASRDAVFISKQDADANGINDGDHVTLENERAQFHGRAFIAPLAPGNLQVHWPEGNPLIDRTRRAPQAGIPDYNATVRLNKDK